MLGCFGLGEKALHGFVELSGAHEIHAGCGEADELGQRLSGRELPGGIQTLSPGWKFGQPGELKGHRVLLLCTKNLRVAVISFRLGLGAST